MVREDPEDSFSRDDGSAEFRASGRALPSAPFCREAVANAFVTLGLLPEPLPEEILGNRR